LKRSGRPAHPTLAAGMALVRVNGHHVLGMAHQDVVPLVRQRPAELEFTLPVQLKFETDGVVGVRHLFGSSLPGAVKHP
jgi:hypothetical protein